MSRSTPRRARRRADPSKSSFFSFRRPVGRREITVFLRELSLVLRAGLNLDDALLLLAGEESAGLASIVRDLRAAITGGASFGDALQRYPKLFGPDLVAMVRVAEASGSLQHVLETVGEERARTEQLLSKVSSSLRYPAVLLTVAIGVLLFFLIVVVPQFGDGAARFRPDARRPRRRHSRRVRFPAEVRRLDRRRRRRNRW